MPVKEKFINRDQLSPESEVVTAYAGLALLSRQERQDRITRSAQAARICAESEWGGEGVNHQHTASFLEGLGDSAVRPEIEDELNSSEYLHKIYDRETRAYLLGQKVRTWLLNSFSAKPGIVGTEGMRTEIVVTNPSRVDATEGDKVIAGKIRTFTAEIYNPAIENIREIVASGIKEGKIDSVKLYPHLYEADQAVGKIILQREQMSQESGRGIAHFTQGELATFPAIEVARVVTDAALIFSAVSCAEVQTIQQEIVNEESVKGELLKWEGKNADHYLPGKEEKATFTISGVSQILTESTGGSMVFGKDDGRFVVGRSASLASDVNGDSLAAMELMFMKINKDGLVEKSWRMDDTSVLVENSETGPVFNVGLKNLDGKYDANIILPNVIGDNESSLGVVETLEGEKYELTFRPEVKEEVKKWFDAKSEELKNLAEFFSVIPARAASLPTETATMPPTIPTPTVENTKEPTATEIPKYPEGFSEEWETRFKMLSIAKGVDFSVTKNEEDKYQVYFVGDQTRLFMGTIETVENAEGEVRDVLKITTAKNEPYRVDTDDLRAKEGGIQIVDPNGHYVTKGAVLLELTENGWEADHILYLAAGPNPYHKYNPNNPNNNGPLDIEGNGLVTGIDFMIKSNIESFLAVMVTENSIGLYDIEGVLHIYPLEITDKVVFSCLKITSNSPRRMCSICEVQELIDLLEEWNNTLIRRQLTYEFNVPPAEDGWGEFYESLIGALETGKNFPDNPQDHKLNLRGVRE